MCHHTQRMYYNRLGWSRIELSVFGISDNLYAEINPARTQEIGAAVEFLGCDGLIAPCVRWQCDNLVLFPDKMGLDANIVVVTSEPVDWISWASEHGMLSSQPAGNEQHL